MAPRKASNMTTDFEIFAKASRQNTGAHFLDSGSAYGRHHEKPPIAEDSPECWIEDIHCGATISTPHFLTKRYTVEENTQTDFYENFLPDFEGTYFEAETAYMEENGFVQVARDNTYNGENDLSQDFVWAVWVPEANQDDDWVYSTDEAIITISVHTGCDVRGGYASPVFCKAEGDYTCPDGLCADWGVIEARDEDGDYCTEEGLSDNWCSGYSSYPFGEVEGDVKRWFPYTKSEDSQSICALLNCGTRVKIGVMISYSGE